VRPHRALIFLLAWGVVVIAFVIVGPFVTRFYAVAGLVMLAASVAAIALDPRNRRRARSLEGCCANCGYDLRGTRGTCPECGKLIPPGTPVHRLPAK
jgi:hypothetical protein